MSIADKLVTIAENEQRVYEAGIESGEQTEYDRFWDEYQQNGNRTNYTNGFGECWTIENFKPKYDMRPTNAYMMFRYIRLGNADLVEYLDSLGVALDFSNCVQMQYTFSGAVISRLGVIDISQAKGNTSGLFNYSDYITTIDLLKVAETNTDLNIFDGCSKLTNITIEGVIAANIGFRGSSKLSDASVDSIIAALQDRNGTSTLTFTVHKDVYARMVANGKDALVTAKNWTLVSA